MEQNTKTEVTNKVQKTQKPLVLTNKQKRELFPSGIKYFSLAWMIFVVVFLLFGYMGYVGFNIFQLKSSVVEESKIEIDESYIKKLNTLEDFGDPVKSNEPGFGRDDPFSGISGGDSEESEETED